MYGAVSVSAEQEMALLKMGKVFFTAGAILFSC